MKKLVTDDAVTSGVDLDNSLGLLDTRFSHDFGGILYI